MDSHILNLYKNASTKTYLCNLSDKKEFLVWFKKFRAV